MPALRFGRTTRINRDLEAFFDVEIGATRGTMPEDAHRGKQNRKIATLGRQARKRRQRLAKKKHKISQLRARLAAHPGSGRSGARTSVGDSSGKAYGALPDFMIIGAMKSGTTYLFHLLKGHPYVIPAKIKEVHYFDTNFDEGPDWYRSHFPVPERKDGRTTITGEATPYYLSHPSAPERAAWMVPEAKLIALLRNPVNRTYSHYQARLRRGRERLGFAEAIEADWRRLQESGTHRRTSYLARSIYVDQLRRWHEFFDRDQLLILKSEDFFARTPETLNHVLSFLGLPAWELDLSSLKGRNKSGYEPMKPETRQWLEEFFEPHNRRLYEYLGVDFGW